MKGVTPAGLEYVSLKLHLVNVVWIRGVREWGKLGRSPWGLTPGVKGCGIGGRLGRVGLAFL